MNFYKTVVIFVFIMIFCSVASAEQITGCHCFTNRQFDAAQTGAVDPYILATTQNSFLAAIFGIDKKQIVQAKMREKASGDDLWIAHFASSKTGVTVNNLLSSRKASGSWKKALEQNNVALKLLGPHFKEAISQNPTDKELSSIVVDQMIIDYFGTKKSEIKNMRVAGSQNKEIIVAAFLSKRTKQPASNFYSSVTSGKSTWGKIFNNLKIETKNIETEINKMINK